MEQLLSDLELIRDGLLDATADYWVPLVEATATMPTWALAAAGAGALALLGVLIFGGRRLRGGDRLDRPDPFLRAPNGDAATPHPVETHNAAIAMPQADAPTPAAAAPQPMEPDPLPDTPEIQGLAEILADRGLDSGGRDGRLRTFAGELDDLRARLATVSAGSASTAQLLRDARGAPPLRSSSMMRPPGRQPLRCRLALTRARQWNRENPENPLISVSFGFVGPDTRQPGRLRTRKWITLDESRLAPGSGACSLP